MALFAVNGGGDGGWVARAVELLVVVQVSLLLERLLAMEALVHADVFVDAVKPFLSFLTKFSKLIRYRSYLTDPESRFYVASLTPV